MGTCPWIWMVRSKNSLTAILFSKITKRFIIRLNPNPFLFINLYMFQLFNPTEMLADLVIEREYVECTSSVIQALLMFKKLYPDHRTREIDRTVEKAVEFIESTQEADGSWYSSLYTSFECISKAKA